MCTWPVVMRVSTATRLRGSSASMASRIASLIWSAILSGCPSVTDSDVKRRRGTRYSPGSAPGRRVAFPPTVPAGGDLPRPQARGPPGSATCGGQQRRYRRPDPGGDGVLAARRQLGHGAAGGQDDDGVVRPAENLTGRDVVDHQQVAALASQLGAGVGEDVAL